MVLGLSEVVMSYRRRLINLITHYVVWLVVVITVALGLQHTPGFACTTTPTPTGTLPTDIPPDTLLANKLQYTPVILEGTVTTITMQPQYHSEIATGQVTQYLKGNGPAPVG